MFLHCAPLAPFTQMNQPLRREAEGRSRKESFFSQGSPAFAFGYGVAGQRLRAIHALPCILRCVVSPLQRETSRPSRLFSRREAEGRSRKGIFFSQGSPAFAFGYGVAGQRLCAIQALTVFRAELCLLFSGRHQACPIILAQTRRVGGTQLGRTLAQRLSTVNGLTRKASKPPPSKRFIASFSE